MEKSKKCMKQGKKAGVNTKLGKKLYMITSIEAIALLILISVITPQTMALQIKNSSTKEIAGNQNTISCPILGGPYITYYGIVNSGEDKDSNWFDVKWCGDNTEQYWIAFYWRQSLDDVWHHVGNYPIPACHTETFTYTKYSYERTETISLKIGDDRGRSSPTVTLYVTIPKISTCFPAGTKITMADGSHKNIENIKRGDRILSYNILSSRFSAWTVSVIPNEPIRSVYEINNGLLSLSQEHPLYIKKSNGKTGWGTLIPDKSFVRIKGDGLTLELGDQLFTSNKEWINVTNITYNCEPVQVYNIWSFSGTQNFFANDILVFEEHATILYLMKYYFGKFLVRFPNTFPVIRHLMGY